VNGYRCQAYLLQRSYVPWGSIWSWAYKTIAPSLGILFMLRYNPTMKTTILPTIGLILLLSSPCAADTVKEPENYCKDPSSWQQWHELLDKHPQDDALYALYATRRGLCTMVESGKIDLERAINIFDQMHKSLMDRKREQERKSRCIRPRLFFISLHLRYFFNPLEKNK